jgi:hypothetical protein
VARLLLSSKLPKLTLTQSISQASAAYSSINVTDLLRSGMSDSQIIFTWLSLCNLQQYYENFVQSGYDLITIMKTTPADLCAIGILDPLHRQLIKQQMKRLNIDDLDSKLTQLLAKIESIDELLKLIHLEQYLEPIVQQGNHKSLDELLNGLSWEDLEEIGIKKLGHQKKLMLVVKRLKEVMAMKSSSSATAQSEQACLNNGGSTTVAITLNTSGHKCEQRSNEIAGQLGAFKSNHLTKSLENLNRTLATKSDSNSSNQNNESIDSTLAIASSTPTKHTNKPVPPTRINSIKFNADPGESSSAILPKPLPPLPPRTCSSTASNSSKPEAIANSYATLPRNRKPRLNVDANTSVGLFHQNIQFKTGLLNNDDLRPSSSSSQTSNSSALSNSSERSSSPISNANDLFLLAKPPPPMPLINIQSIVNSPKSSKASSISFNPPLNLNHKVNNPNPLSMNPLETNVCKNK